MKPGKHGEVIFEPRTLDAHYARMGALATGNAELFSAVSAARKDRDRGTGESVLPAEHKKGLIDGLNKLSSGNMYGLLSTITFTYPQFAEQMIEDISVKQPRTK